MRALPRWRDLALSQGWGGLTYVVEWGTPRLVKFLCSVFVMSWSGVIRFHNQRPVTLAGQPAGVFVANHSSMIDFIVLQQTNSYAVVRLRCGPRLCVIRPSVLRP